MSVCFAEDIMEIVIGGAILSTRKTETYSAGAPVLKLFGIPICQQQNTPHAIIQVTEYYFLIIHLS